RVDARYVQAPVSIEGAAAFLGIEEIVDRRRVHHAGGDLAILLERNQRREERNAADEALGAVDVIADPPPARARLLAVLFAQHTVLGERLAQYRDGALLGLAIG